MASWINWNTCECEKKLWFQSKCAECRKFEKLEEARKNEMDHEFRMRKVTQEELTRQHKEGEETQRQQSAREMAANQQLLKSERQHTENITRWNMESEKIKSEKEERLKEVDFNKLKISEEEKTKRHTESEKTKREEQKTKQLDIKFKMQADRNAKEKFDKLIQMFPHHCSMDDIRVICGFQDPNVSDHGFQDPNVPNRGFQDPNVPKKRHNTKYRIHDMPPLHDNNELKLY